MKFNETKSQERLINMMLQAGVEWPEGADAVCQEKNEDYRGRKYVLVFFHNSRKDEMPNAKPSLEIGEWCDEWPMHSLPTVDYEDPEIALDELNPNWYRTVVYKEQYEARDGWITWHGGECPIDDATPYEIMKRTGEIIKGEGFASLHGNMWFHDRGDSNLDITAYRLSKEHPADEPCESVKACIPDQPTIEQLIAEWKRLDGVAEKSREVAERDQAAFDSAAEAVEEALKKAGWN